VARLTTDMPSTWTLPMGGGGGGGDDDGSAVPRR